MAKRTILYLGNPVLREKAREVSEINGEIAQLAEDLKETMLAAPGIGLAAPQIGLSLRVIAYVANPREEDEEPKAEVLINPRVVEASDETEAETEGCLSLPTLQAEVERPAEVLVEGVTVDGDVVQIEASGLLARIFLHEIDHLDGVVFIDRADPESLVWVVPDEKAEGGCRYEPTTVEEAVERFARLAERQMQRLREGEC